jgi:hypothetical protein
MATLDVFCRSCCLTHSAVLAYAMVNCLRGPLSQALRIIPGAAKGLVTSLRKRCVWRLWYIMGTVVCISRPPELTTISNYFKLQNIPLYSTHIFIPTSQRPNYNGRALHFTPLSSHCGSLALANSGSSNRWWKINCMVLLILQ